MAKPVILLMGYPASGKSTIAREYEQQGFMVLNRDKLRGKVTDLLPLMEQHLRDGKNVLLDNTYPTAESRKPFIELAVKLGRKIKCLWLASTIEQSQFNACLRMVRKYGKLLSPAEISKATDDPNMFPPAWPFRYRKIFEKPSTAEGFEEVTKRPFILQLGSEYKNAAYIFDYDGTLRDSKGPQNWPVKPSEVILLPGRERIKTLTDVPQVYSGFAPAYPLLGASNQSAIAKGDLSEADAIACFDKTNELLGVDIDYEFCPHKIPPISCWCRKPMPGWGVHFIEKYKLDPEQVTMIGDMTSDKTFASRCGFRYVDAEEFFA